MANFFFGAEAFHLHRRSRPPTTRLRGVWMTAFRRDVPDGADPRHPHLCRRHVGEGRGPGFPRRREPRISSPVSAGRCRPYGQSPI